MAASFLGAFKADTLIARGQARCAWRSSQAVGPHAGWSLTRGARSTLAGGASRWREEDTPGGNGRIFFLDGDVPDDATSTDDEPR